MPLQLHSAGSGLGPQRTEVVNTAAVQQIFDRVGFK